MKSRPADPDAVVRSAPVEKVYPAGPGPTGPIPAGIPTQTLRQGMKDTLRTKTFSPVGKQRPPGPKVYEVTDKEEGGELFSPVEKTYPLGPGPVQPAGMPTQTSRQGMKDTIPKRKSGPRVV
ncbi:MAG: hypothetical protein AAB368_14455 [bacterium]